MFMRIAWGRLKPGCWSDYESSYRTATAGRKEPGLLQRYLIRDMAMPDAGFSITVWESEAAMTAYEKDETRREKAIAPMRAFFTGDFHVQRCRVVMAESHSPAA